MTRCDEIQGLLALRPEDRSVTEERRVSAHLAVCAECAARAEVYAEQDRVIRSAPRVALTPSQRGQLLSTIERKRRRHEAQSKLFTVAGTAVAIMALIAMVVGAKLLAPSDLQQLIPGAPLLGDPSELPAGRTARFTTVDFAAVGHERTGCVTLGSGEERCPPEGQAYVWVAFIVENSEHYPTTDDGPQIAVVHQGQTLPEMLFLPEGKTPRSVCTPDGHYRDEPCHFWVGATVPADARIQDIAVRASWDDKIAIWPLGDGRDVRLLSEGQFQWPTARRDISGWTVDDPRNNDHPGIDIIAEQGEPIAAVAEGVVTFADSKDDYGNLVIIEHEDGWTSRYAQLDEVLVAVDQHVIPGQYVGRAGSTGNSSGPHLHFELRQDGQPVNPLNYLPPISGESFRSFRPIVFADEIELAQRDDAGSPSRFQLETAPSDPSAPQSVVATLHWRVLQRPSTEWRVFAHLEDEAGQLRVQEDAGVDWPEEPCAEDELDPPCTTTSILTMTLPTDLPEGVYTMRVGLYDVETGKRAPVTAGVTAGETSVGVWQVELPPLDHLPSQLDLRDLLLQEEELPGSAPDDPGADYWKPTALPLPDVPDDEGWIPNLASQEAPVAAFQVEGPRVTERQDGSSAVAYVMNAVYAFETPGQASRGYEALLAQVASETLGSVETLYDGTAEGGTRARAVRFEGSEGDAVYWLFGVKEQHLHLLMVNGLDDDATKGFFEATMAQVLTRGND